MHVHKTQDWYVYMNTLVLIKHSIPTIEESLPASAWHLSEEGRDKCEALGRELSKYSPANIYSSEEPKALETAQLSISSQLSDGIITDSRLNEHHRETLKYQNQSQFESLVKDFFEFPDKLIFGEETANQAFTRYKDVIDEILSNRNPACHSLVFSHGTVISLWVARTLDIAPFPFWEKLTLPSYIAIKPNYPPDFELVNSI